MELMHSSFSISASSASQTQGNAEESSGLPEASICEAQPIGPRPNTFHGHTYDPGGL